MSRGNTGRESSNDAFHTLNAAASVIASSENRAPHATLRQKRRWGGWFRLYWCFGYQKQTKRIGHADVIPEPSAQRNPAPAAENPSQAPLVMQPFVAPPSSPASFFQSEPPSITQSPAGLVSVSANMYSPGGPASIFAIGPYAHETQLVSPPVFSTFTTEPSTAPFTPPPESVHLTTPSSPEVPFAQLFGPNIQNSEGGPRFPLYNYDFPSYQLYPGSPVGQLISPSSGISGSGTSSPFPDGEISAAGCYFLEFPMPDPPKLMSLDKLSTHRWSSHQGSGTLTPDSTGPAASRFEMNPQISDALLHHQLGGTSQGDQVSTDNFSLNLNATLASIMPRFPGKVTPKSPENGRAGDEESSNPNEQTAGFRLGETSSDPPEKAAIEVHEQPCHQKHRSITLGSLTEFNFDNANGDDHPNSGIRPDWWANGGVTTGSEQGAHKNWSFFTTMHPNVS